MCIWTTVRTATHISSAADHARLNGRSQDIACPNTDTARLAYNMVIETNKFVLSQLG